MVWLDKNGWPLTYFKGRPVVNFFRWLFRASVVKSVAWRGRWVYTRPGALSYMSPGLPSGDTLCCEAAPRRDGALGVYGSDPNKGSA